MARRVFFSFKYKQDVSRAMVVKNSWVTQGREAAGFIDAADFEKLKRQGDTAIKNWINKQLEGTSVTVVLVGERCGEIPKGYDFYLWYKNDGYNKMGDWIEKAAKEAGR